jgi:trans-L-3-hydroxyproline dehydratase
MTGKKWLNDLKWSPPASWQKITAIDIHTEGEPLRVILSGFPELEGDTILARRRFARENFDLLRKTLMWEPRGHADMYGCIITTPTNPNSDFGVLFLHNEGFSTMCGHGIIGVTKAVLELSLFPMQTPVTPLSIDTPAGLVTSYARISNNQVESVYFHNVPSFVVGLDDHIKIEGLGKIEYDLAFGGAFYAFVDADKLGLSMEPDNFRELIRTGMIIKNAIMKERKIDHPFDSELSFLYGVIFTGKAIGKGADTRNVCIFANGEVDRSPTGTGVSARMAIYYARGDIAANKSLVFESIIGTRFSGRVVETVRQGPYKAVIPEVEGTAHIIARNEFYIDPDDPLRHGFMLR